MATFNRIQTSFFTKKLIKTRQKRASKGVSLQAAQSILLLFDASKPSDVLFLQEKRDIWVSQGKKIFLMGVHPNKKEEELKSFPFPCFSSKDFSWDDSLKDTKRLQNIQVELLLCYNPKQLRSLHFIATCAQAGFKVGSLPEEGIPSDFDFVLDIQKSISADFFMKNSYTYLNTIEQRDEQTKI